MLARHCLTTPCPTRDISSQQGWIVCASDSYLPPEILNAVMVGMPVTRHPPGRRVAQFATQTPAEPGVQISRTWLFRD
ncbi:MAG: hypothetical protein ACYC49_12420 [Ignavibacteriaceae bacterium]